MTFEAGTFTRRISYNANPVVRKKTDLSKGTKQKLDGFLYGPFAVHPVVVFDEFAWRVTHKATGCQVGGDFRNLAQTVKFIERALPVLDWSDPLNASPGAYKQCAELYREIVGRKWPVAR